MNTDTPPPDEPSSAPSWTAEPYGDVHDRPSLNGALGADGPDRAGRGDIEPAGFAQRDNGDSDDVSGHGGVSGNGGEEPGDTGSTWAPLVPPYRTGHLLAATEPEPMPAWTAPAPEPARPEARGRS